MARKISGITIEIDGNTTKLQDSLKKVDSQLKTTQNELKNVERKLKLNPSGFELLKQKQKDLQTAIKQTEERLKMLKQAQENAVKGTQEWDNLQREINDTEAELKGLEAQYKEFGSAAAQAVKQVGEKMKDIGGKMQEVGRNMTRYVTLPIVAAGTAAVKKFAEVDKTMQLTNKTMGNSAEEAELLNDAMENAAANSIFGMSEAATATLNFARAGLNAKQSAFALAPAMNLAAGEGGNLDTVSQGLVATINGFQDGFENAADYADVFAAACNNSALDIDSMVGAMSTAAPIFNTAGYTIRDAALYMGIMANNGIEASEAANALKTGLAKLISPAKEGSEWMEKLGITVTNTDGSMKDSVTIQRELHDAFAGLSESEQIAAASAIFGKNQMSKWLALINTAPESVDDLSDSLEKCKGTTDEMSTAMMGGFGGSIEKLKSSLDVLMTSLGRLAAEFLQPVIDKVQGWVDKFNSLDDGTKKTIIKIAGIVAAVGPLLIIGGKLITGIGMLLTFAPMIGSAFLPIVAVIGLIIAAGILLIKNWDKLKKGVKQLVKDMKKGWDTLKKDVVQAATDIKTKVTNAWNTMKTSVTNTVNNLKTTVQTAWTNLKTNVTNTVNNLKTSVQTAWNNLKTNVTNTVNNLKTAVTTAWNNLKTAVVNTVNNLKSSLQTAWNNIKTTVVNAVNSLKTTVTTAWESLKTSVVNTANNLKSSLETAWNNIKTSVTNAVNNLKTNVTNAWSNLKSSVETVVSNLHSSISNAWSNIQSSVSNAVSNLKSSAVNAFNSVKDSASSIFESIKSAITSKIEAAKSAISNTIQSIKNLFNFSWSLPHIKVPHFGITGYTTILGAQIPQIGVSWYKKAYENPVMFTSPTVVATPGGMKGFGDGHGAEIVLGLNKLRELVGSSGDITVNVYAQPGMNEKALADMVAQRIQQTVNNRRAVWA